MLDLMSFESWNVDWNENSPGHSWTLRVLTNAGSSPRLPPSPSPDSSDWRSPVWSSFRPDFLFLYEAFRITRSRLGASLIPQRLRRSRKVSWNWAYFSLLPRNHAGSHLLRTEELDSTLIWPLSQSASISSVSPGWSASHWGRCEGQRRPLSSSRQRSKAQ